MLCVLACLLLLVVMVVVGLRECYIYMHTYENIRPHLGAQVEVCDVPHRLEGRGRLHARGEEAAEHLLFFFVLVCLVLVCWGIHR